MNDKTVRDSCLISAGLAVLIVAVTAIAQNWPTIQNAGILAGGGVLALVLWVVSWPYWVWICFAILSAANRIARAIDRASQKKEKA